jgi:putative colanic acid biosynthesis glycosyltransferase WcaI
LARVLLLSQFFPPETFAGANRVGSMADALARFHDVVVVTPRPGYPNPSVYDAQGALEADRQRPYRVERTLEFVPRSRSLAVRAVREHFMGLRLAWRATREEADIVVTSSPSMFLGPICWLLARVKSSLFAWDIRDIGWEYAGESELVSGRMRPLLKALQVCMWYVVSRADLLVAATPGIAERLSEGGASRDHILLVGNSVTKELLDACALCQERVPKTRPIVSYVGLIGDAQALLVLADVAGLLPTVDFLVAGDGPERDLLERKIHDLGRENLKVTGYLARPDVLEIYRNSDILFAQLKDTPTLNVTGLPSKLHEYMATGKPIVYAGKGLAAETLQQIGCAVTVAPEESETIAAAIAALLRDDTWMAELGRKGRAFVEACPDRETALEELATVLIERFEARGEGPLDR